MPVVVGYIYIYITTYEPSRRRAAFFIIIFASDSTDDDGLFIFRYTAVKYYNILGSFFYVRRPTQTILYTRVVIIIVVVFRTKRRPSVFFPRCDRNFFFCPSPPPLPGSLECVSRGIPRAYHPRYVPKFVCEPYGAASMCDCRRLVDCSDGGSQVNSLGRL